jgi:radical SAM protein with 4Fe4S-binding SPASM domain
MNSKVRLIRQKVSNIIYPNFPWVFSLRVPRLIALEATNRCNLKCLTCPIPEHITRRRGEMSLETFNTLLKQINWRVERFNWNYGGEPLLNKNLFSMILFAWSKGIPSKVDTNGMLIHKYINDIFKSHLYILNVALESNSDKEFRLGYNPSQVISAISEISNFKKIKRLNFPIINMNYIVKRTNETQINEAIKLSRDIGADFIIMKSLHINPGAWLSEKDLLAIGQKFLPIKHHEFSRYVFKDGKFIYKENKLNYCTYLSNSVTITWDGGVLPCCCDFDGTMEVGNINFDSLEDIWKSCKFKHVRKQILNKRMQICKNCAFSAPQKKIKLNQCNDNEDNSIK